MALERLGPYRLEKTLGRGGMGAVFLGVHDSTGERAAVKVLAPNLADDALFRERFKSEVETLKKLLHPNIVRLHAWGEEENGNLYYVMEYVPGRNLQDELAAGRRFTWREVTRLGVQIAQALKHAHDRGIVHRDLKPANLLLTDDDQIKLTDFGIAKFYGGSHMTADGSVMGTADYMSPEQARGKQVTSRCDLYSLGSVLYALLTGKPPFAGKSLTEVIHNLMQEKPVALRRLAPDTPGELEAIVLQLLEKDPQKRIPTAIAVVNRLKALEHALSLETQLDLPAAGELTPLPPDDADFQLEPLDNARPGARPTTRNSNATPTVDLSATGGSAPNLASAGQHTGELPTLITGATPSPLAGVPTKATSYGTINPSAPTSLADRGEYELAPAPKSTHFTTISEAELRGHRNETDSHESNLLEWAKIAGVLLVGLVAIGVVAFVMTRPPSADQLAHTIQAAYDRQGTDGILDVESDLTRFLQEHGDDPRAEQFRVYAQDLELYRLQRNFERRVRRSSEEKGLLPVERLYLQAQRNVTADPAAALAQFQALVQLLKDDHDPAASALDERAAEQCLLLAERQIEQLKTVVEAMQQQQRLLIRRQLARAEKLAEGKPDEAAAIRQSIVTLFGDKPWAADLVSQAQTPASTIEVGP
jgi:serine/threonine-protein kinase